MTISYAGEVPNGSSFGCFWRILLKWRGSVYKLVWRELLAYFFLYYTINLVYRYALNEQQQRTFEKIRQYCASQSEIIPMSFVLGFYVSLVVKRWWDQYKLLPWPDTLALFISAAIPGNNETGRLMRRNVMRYMILAYVITLQRISLRVKRRFPSSQHLVDAGLMMESERKIFEVMNAKSPMSKYWMPLVWATNIINRARKDGLISSDHLVQTILMELSDIRRRLGSLIGYDTVCVPLVYTQVVTLVLYSYFIAALMGKQMLPINDSNVGGKQDPDLYFPVFTALQFGFYVGWLKVAEVLINPFGEDDDDIELNWLIDRHIKAAYMIVDEMHEEHPELLKDQYWEEVVPKDLPYTVASEHYRRYEPKGSADFLKVKTSDAMYANIIPTKRLADDVYADYESVDTPMVERRKNWFSRQITRMGSGRSQSTAYSSGGLFNRNRLNSVYANPEVGLPLSSVQPVQKMSLYDKFVNRKSIRAQRQLMKQNSKLSINGSAGGTGGGVGSQQRNRPRIPTPDVTKESIEKENRLNLAAVTPTTTNNNNSNSIASGVALMAHQLATTPAMYPQNNPPQDVSVVGTLLLSPIKEMDSSSTHNTLQADHPATAALAQAVLPKTLQNAGFAPVSIASSNALSGNTQLSTLSFPFAVTTTDSVSTPGTLSLVSMMPTTSVPQINSPTNVFSNDVVPIASIPIPVSLTRANSTGSITKHLSDTTNSNNHLNIENEKTPLSRASSTNNIPLDVTDSYHLERKYSERSKPIESTENSLIINSNNKNKNNININNNNNNIKQQSVESSISAPSTLTKRKPETKTGEVYV